MHKHARLGGGGLGHSYFTRRFRCSEIASEAIFGDRSRAVVATRFVSSNFWLSMYAFAKPADFEFHERRY